MSDTALNQYAAPTAEVADVTQPAATAELKLFSARGRIGRLRYLAYSTGATLVYSVALGLLAATIMTNLTAAEVVAYAAYIPLLWFTIITGIKRCHDIGISGWWALTVIIPVIALVWLFVPGNKGENRFGPPPPPNNWGVRVLGAIVPVFFLVGILAAVALPAYQSYVLRAKAAQAAGQR